MKEIIPFRELWKREEEDNKELREIIEKRDKEIERLNNIINELEKYLWRERYNHSGEYMFTSGNKIEDVYTMILDKLKELKEKF